MLVFVSLGEMLQRLNPRLIMTSVYFICHITTKEDREVDLYLDIPWQEPTQPRKGWPHHRGSASPTLFELWRGFFYVPQEPDKWNCCEIGPTVFRPYWRRLENLTICRCHYKDIKTALSSQLFKDPDCWSRRALNPWPTSQQTSTLPTELTRRRCCIWKLEFKPCCALFPQKRNFASLSLFTSRCMDECWRCTVTCDGLSSHPARNRNIRLMLWKPWWASKHFCRLYLTSQSVEWLFQWH